MDKDIETRIIDAEDSEIRKIESGRTIEGYAIVFNKPSKDLGGFREIIAPEAIQGVIERSDVLALVNHNIDKGVLARSTNGSGSLSLTVDQKGVLYRFTAPDTALGNELVEGIKRGDIRTSSFAFTVEGQAWDKNVKPMIRTVTKFKNLFDVSAVYREAYEDTSVAMRNFNEIEQSLIPEVAEVETKSAIVEAVTEPMEQKPVRDEQEVMKRFLKYKKMNERLKTKNK